MNKDHYVSQFYNKPWYIYNGTEISGPTDFLSVVKLFKSNPQAQNYFLCQKGMTAWQKIKDTIELHEILKNTSVEDEKQAFTTSVEQQITTINSHTQQPRSNLNTSSYTPIISANPLKNEFDQIIKELREEASTYTSNKFPATPTINNKVPTKFESSSTNNSKLNVTPPHNTYTSISKEESLNLKSSPLKSTSASSSNTDNTSSNKTSISKTISKEPSIKKEPSSSFSSLDTSVQTELKQKVPITIGKKTPTLVRSLPTDNFDYLSNTAIPSTKQDTNSKLIHPLLKDHPSNSKIHTFHKVSSKNRTYRKSLTVPPPSKEMLDLLTSNRLRLGQKKSLLASSIIFPVCSFGLYYIYWLIRTYQLITRHLSIGFSPLFFFSCVPGLHYLGCYHLLCLLDRMHYEDLNYSSSQHKKVEYHLFSNFVKTLLLAWCPPLFVIYFQNRLNVHWGFHDSQLKTPKSPSLGQ